MKVRPNYGLALSSNGSYQIIDTLHNPGISDEWSSIRNNSFTLLIAPSYWIDSLLLLEGQASNYQKQRHMLMRMFPQRYRDAILQYFNR